MRSGPTLVRAVGVFVVTTVTFAAAMVIAYGLSIPDPASRFLPGAARELAGLGGGTAPPQELELASDGATAPAHPQGEPVTEVTAVPVPTSEDDAAVADGSSAAGTGRPDGAAVSATGGRVATSQPPGSARVQGTTRSPGRNWTWPSATPSASPPPSEEESEPAPSEPDEPDPGEAEPSEPTGQDPELRSEEEPVPSEPTESESTEVPTESPFEVTWSSALERHGRQLEQ
jgi:hypothetical protein